MTSTDRNQMMTEIFFLGQKGQFAVSFADYLKGAFTYQDVHQRLEKKRKAYNFAFVNVMKKYGLCPDDLDSRLDRLWQKVSGDGSTGETLEGALKDVGIGKALLFRLGAGWATCGVASVASGALDAIGASRLKTVWMAYLSLTMELAESLGGDDEIAPA
jgi:hypothetical protein